jgi:hypothetical protein
MMTKEAWLENSIRIIIVCVDDKHYQCTVKFYVDSRPISQIITGDNIINPEFTFDKFIAHVKETITPEWIENQRRLLRDGIEIK